MASISSLSSSTGLETKKYDYDTLPTFRNLAAANGNTSSSQLALSPQHTDRKAKSPPPFVSRDRLFSDTLLGEQLRKPSVASTKPAVTSSHTQPSFPSTSTAKRTLFSKQINGMFHSFSESVEEEENKIKQKLKESKEAHEADDTDMLKVVQLFWVALAALGHKAWAWVVFLLNLIASKCLHAAKSIPEPTVTTNNELDMLPASTPVNNKVVSAPTVDTASKVATAPIVQVSRPSTPKTSKELQINVSPVQADVKTGYGTHFFETSKPSPNNDIDAMFLKSNYQAAKAETTFDSSKLLHRSTLSQAPVKPTFTRSSDRFKDMEWLKNDNEDYLNNLESTNLFKEYQKIMEERLKTHELKKLSKMKESAKVKPLTSYQLSQVDAWWKSRDPNRNIITKFGIDICVRDLSTLSDCHWLNDSIIDFYMSLIKQRSQSGDLPAVHCFSTFFYTNLSQRGYGSVKKWAKRAKVDVTKMDYIFCPINLHQSHWALGVINNREQSFDYYDSLYGTGNEVLSLLETYMEEETVKNYGPSMDGHDYTKYDYNANMQCPSQKNGYDCGVFACTTADYLSRGLPLLYSQADMRVLRRRMAYEVGTGEMVTH